MDKKIKDAYIVMCGKLYLNTQGERFVAVYLRPGCSTPYIKYIEELVQHWGPKDTYKFKVWDELKDYIAYKRK